LSLARTGSGLDPEREGKEARNAFARVAKTNWRLVRAKSDGILESEASLPSQRKTAKRQ
jgi:hypothetical protein